jgi:hypothetical protein
VQECEQAARPLFSYLPWLEGIGGTVPSSTYAGQELAGHSMTFPVYDGNLMRFVKEAAKSPLMDRNYRYLYTRKRLKTPDDERKAIAAATWKEWDVLRGILSRYVLEGMVKGSLWNQAVKENIFYLVLRQMKFVLQYWGKPFAD